MNKDTLGIYVLNSIVLGDFSPEQEALDQTRIGIPCSLEEVHYVVALLRKRGFIHSNEYLLTESGERWLDDRFFGRNYGRLELE